jgi:hypothetical protein
MIHTGQVPAIRHAAIYGGGGVMTHSELVCAASKTTTMEAATTGKTTFGGSHFHELKPSLLKPSLRDGVNAP